jgi:succinylglutamate desuccinylase
MPMITLTSHAAIEQAIAISAVDGIHPNPAGMEILRKIQDGSLSYEQAIARVLDLAKQYSQQPH